jgi:transcriptional regulator with XRE-family HTH domain
MALDLSQPPNEAIRRLQVTGLSQRKIAVAVGVSRMTVGRWFAGHSLADSAARAKVESALGVPVGAWEQAPEASTAPTPPEAQPADSFVSSVNLKGSTNPLVVPFSRGAPTARHDLGRSASRRLAQ